MSYSLTLEEIAVIDELLTFLPVFENSEFKPATWPKRTYLNAKGQEVMMMPSPDYAKEVEEFRTLYPRLAGAVHPYDRLPEDDAAEGIKFSPGGTTFSIEYFSTASFHQVCRYLMLLGRGERFCDGHIEGEIKNGKVGAALRRLAVLRADAAP